MKPQNAEDCQQVRQGMWIEVGRLIFQTEDLASELYRYINVIFFTAVQSREDAANKW